MIYAMGDIHGNLRRFNSVMEQIDLQPEDTLYVLGDVIDRHPYGIQILRKLMSMKNVRMILGNHEYMMMKAIGVPGEPKTASESATRLWYRNGGEVTHQALKRLRIKTRKEMFAYLHALPLNIDIEVGGETYRLVHGGDLGEYVRYRLDYYDETYFAVWKRYELTELRRGSIPWCLDTRRLSSIRTILSCVYGMVSA